MSEKIKRAFGNKEASVFIILIAVMLIATIFNPAFLTFSNIMDVLKGNATLGICSMGMLLIILVGFLPALNIVGEKEKGTIEQINVTPVSKIEFIVSKLVPYTVVGIFLLTFAMVLAWAIHGITPAGSIGLIYAFALVFCLVVASIGLIISNYSSNTQQAALTFFFFMMIFMLMSGLLTPVASMPAWSRAITELNPMRFAMEAFRTLYLKDAGFHDLSAQFWRLCIMAAVLWVWAIASYRKKS